MNTPTRSASAPSAAVPVTFASAQLGSTRAPIRTVLVLGSAGRFGAAAVHAFAAAGWRVVAQARRAPARLPDGARHVGADLRDLDTLASAAAGARVVVHAVNPLYTRWEAEALPLARRGMDVAERLGARFLLPGNVYGYGAGMPPLLRPETPERPTTRKGEIRRDLEAELDSRAAAGRLRSVVVRAGDFFGGGTGSWLDLAIVKSIARGRLVYPGPLDRDHAWAYLPDLARACVAVAAHDDLPPAARLHFAGHTLNGAEMLAALERAAVAVGITPPSRGWRHGTMPWALLRVGGLVVPMWREIAAMRYLWDVPHALDGTVLAEVVGDVPHTPLDVALEAALRALGHGVRTGVAHAAVAA
jgi:nucleoside-diphosphate-sugar epimerase